VDRVNGFLDHGNYLAYGYASVVLHTLGVPFAFPVLHGKTRRGALIFDVADLIKDATVMPHAFSFGMDSRKKDSDFRAAVVAAAHNNKVMDFMIDKIKVVCKSS
jgi:CRISPR-associated protein Cas1